MQITIEANDHGVSRLLTRIQNRTKSAKPAMSIIGSIVRASVVRNFEKEGRPQKWRRHSKKTIALRGVGAKILRDQGFAGGLLGSINYKAFNDRVIIGTNKNYAATHQFGDEKKRIPARPFLMVQDEDWPEIRAALNEYIMKGAAK